MKQKPDHIDADLALKVYDLRRETVMRQSRSIMAGQFWPKSYEEFVAVTQPSHDWNAAFRQVTSFWEMVYGFAKHGIVNPDFWVENNGEGIFIFSKFHPYVERFRKEVAPTAFTNVEWIVTNSETGRTRFEMMKKRVAGMLAQH